MRLRSEWILALVTFVVLALAWHQRIDKVVARTMDGKAPVNLKLTP